MAKTIQEALAEVQRRLDELVVPIDANRATRQVPRPAGAPMPASGSTTSAAPAPAPRPAPRPVPRPAAAAAPAPASGGNKYGFAASGSDQDTSANFFRADRVMQADKAASAAPAPAARTAPAPAARPTQTPRPATTPRPAVSDPKVLQQQKDLISKGYNIKADGIMGPKTAAAAKDFGSAASRDDQEQGAAMRAAATKSNASDALKKAQERSTGTDENGNMLPPTRPAAPAPAPGVDPNDTRESPRPAPAASENQETQRRLDPDVTETESGPSKGKKKMSESALITAFMKLQQTKSGNIFEAAKKMKTRYEGSKGDEGDSMTSEPDGPANSMTNEPPKGETKKKPEDYFKKDSPNAAEKPSEDEIDRRMRVALGHSKGPEDYFKIPNKAKSTEVADKKDDGDKDNKSSASAETSVSIDGGVPSTTKVSKTVSVANKRKISESTLIDAFLKINESKKAKKDYDGDGKVESGKDEYLGSRIAAAKKAGKMEEELKGKQKNIDANKNGKIDADDFRKLRSGKKSEKMKAYRADRDKHGEMEEETDPGFSEAELAHFEAVINRKDQKGKERAMGDTVASEDLTDEYINEMARKPGETRGRKAGTKVQGGYKNTKSKRGGDDAKGGAVEADEPKGVPHVLDQIRHGREDEHGFKTITHPASSPEAPVTKKIHRSDLHGFYDKYHNTEKPAAKEKEYSGFLDKHFGDSRTSAPTSQSFSTDLSKVEKANLKGGAGKVSLGGSKLVGGKK